MAIEQIADVMTELLSSKDGDSLVDVAQDIANGLSSIGYAITPNASGNKDASGGYVTSLTEAVMGVTAGLCRIADSIQELASAIREKE